MRMNNLFYKQIVYMYLKAQRGIFVLFVIYRFVLEAFVEWEGEGKVKANFSRM